MSTTLKFCVQGQRITRADAIVTVADAINYIYAEFAFCSDWDGLVKTAVFTRGSASYEALLDQDDRCLVPYEILEDGPGIFKASVFAGNLITTAPVKVRIDASGWSFALESSQPPTPSVYQQIIDRMTDIETDMETATAAAEASAVLAESYAKGGTSTRQGEDTDNARYYSEQASGSAEEAAQIVQDFDDDVVAGAIAAVEAAGTEQIGAVNTAGATQVGAVESAGSTQATAVNTAGSTQIGLVQAKGTEQVAAVQAKGTEVIGSIPQDYSDLSDDVSDLKSALDDLVIISGEQPTAAGNKIWIDSDASSVQVPTIEEYNLLLNYIPTAYISGDAVGFSDGANDFPIKSMTINNAATKVDQIGKNFLPEWTINRLDFGITYSPMADGGIHAEGTVTATAWLYIKLTNDAPLSNFGLKAGQKMCGSTNETHFLARFKDSSKQKVLDVFVYKNQPQIFTIPDDAVYIDVTLYSNDTIGVVGEEINVDLYPMIELGEVATAWERSIHKIYNITNGQPDTVIKTLLGSNYFFSDVGTIAIEYRQDIKALINEATASQS